MLRVRPSLQTALSYVYCLLDEPIHIRNYRRGRRNASISRNASSQAGVVPGIPSPSTRTPTTYMSFAMPDISIQPSQPRPQIPYLPDFWQSSKNAPQPSIEPSLPKISVVSPLNTTHSHNLHDENASPDTLSVGPGPGARSFGKGGILEDVSEDLGIPSPKQIKAGVSNFLQSFR
ncbi:hypothetical protein B0H13DRAFT_1938971 [Mycena leptocephala]|nr:hypothetical protein B0H13DRAFT_1938971 [Mycena leptocephala]